MSEWPGEHTSTEVTEWEVRRAAAGFRRTRTPSGLSARGTRVRSAFLPRSLATTSAGRVALPHLSGEVHGEGEDAYIEYEHEFPGLAMTYHHAPQPSDHVWAVLAAGETMR